MSVPSSFESEGLVIVSIVLVVIPQSAQHRFSTLKMWDSTAVLYGM